MKTETALTAFCMTTVALIVGLVMLTAVQLKITDPVIVGQYIGLSALAMHIEPTNVVLVQVDPADSSCYQKGVKECQRSNTRQNFVHCIDHVAVECGMQYTKLTRCFLAAGFELNYLSKRECAQDVIDECQVRCPVGAQKECVESSKGRCALIGGRFQGVYQQEKYTAYSQVAT